MGGWTTQFKQALNEPQLFPRWSIEWVQIPTGTLRTFGGNIRLSSWDQGPGFAPLITPNSSFSGGRLTPRSWNAQPGAFQLTIDGFKGFAERQIIQRGQVVTLRVGLRFNNVWHTEDVMLAQVMNITYTGRGWVLDCRGIEGALNSRWTTDSGKQLLCHDLADTTVDSPYNTPGGTLDVASTAGFRTDGQGTGMLLVTDNNGEQYFVSYTNTTATSFTGCTANIFGTTHDNTAIGNRVQEVAYTRGHPLKVLERILKSTGQGTNGVDDILPESWGFGIDAELIDDRDILEHIDYTRPTTGGNNWDLLITETVNDAQAFLNNWLNGAGYFITQHQGRLTGRAALLPWAQGTSGTYIITDDDIESITGYWQWGADSSNASEYQRTQVTFADGPFERSALSEVDHLPAKGINNHVCGGLYSDNGNATALITELVARLKEWDIRTPEIMRLTLRGWKHGQASPGDTVKLTTGLFPSRDGLPFVDRDCLVLRSSPNWFGASTDIELAILPADEVVPWRA